MAAAHDIIGESARPRVLVADDQPAVRDALRLLLKNKGFEAKLINSPDGLLAALDSQEFDVVLLDLNYTRDTTSGAEGLDVLSRIRMKNRTVPVVVMTAWGSVDLAVEAMRRGASDFVQKPWDNARLVEVLRAQTRCGEVARNGLREQNEEMEEASRIQKRLLPAAIPQIPGYEVSATWRPAGAVGGDYFDALKFSSYRMGLCIADVSGKGLPAALLMSNLQAAVKTIASKGVSPAELCLAVNHVVHQNTAASRFISFFYCVLDTHRNRLAYCNAGHNRPILVRRNGQQERLAGGGPVLGAFLQAQYEQGEIEARPGDRLLLFTDGISECSNANGEEFGEQRLAALAAEKRALPAGELQTEVMRAVALHGGGHFQDDATLIAIAVGETHACRMEVV